MAAPATATPFASYRRSALLGPAVRAGPVAVQTQDVGERPVRIGPEQQHRGLVRGRGACPGLPDGLGELPPAGREQGPRPQALDRPLGIGRRVQRVDRAHGRRGLRARLRREQNKREIDPHAHAWRRPSSSSPRRDRASSHGVCLAYYAYRARGSARAGGN
jgi:hypothetical protein